MSNTDSTPKIGGWTHVIAKDEQFLYDTHPVTNIVKYHDRMVVGFTTTYAVSAYHH